jgi:hypothetical protein
MLTKEQKDRIDDYVLDIEVPSERLSTYKYSSNPYDIDWDEDEEESRQYEIAEENMLDDPYTFLCDVLGDEIDELYDQKFDEFENLEKECQEYLEKHITWDSFDDF